jgi:hypothetical protein
MTTFARPRSLRWLVSSIAAALLVASSASCDEESPSLGPGDDAGVGDGDPSTDPGSPDPGSPDPGSPDPGAPPTGGFVDVGPPLGDPLPGGPAGEWTYLQVEGSQCRDGSPAGFYYRYSDTSSNLMIFLEGGGACFNGLLCIYNPRNVNESLEGETIVEAIGGVQPEPQTPRTRGILDVDHPDNPVADWNMVYVPYCTGDVHAGARHDQVVPDLLFEGPQQFVGYLNMQKFLGRIIPTFQDADQVLLAGVSAGGVGAVLNYPQTQDGFGDIPVYVLDDSGPAFADAYMAPCMQQAWRDLWGFDDIIPPDCGDRCFQEDGGGLVNLLRYAAEKYPNLRGGLISTLEDEIIRLFYGNGNNDCTPNLLEAYPADTYTAALRNLRDEWLPPGVGTYYMSGALHQHVFRDRFYGHEVDGMSQADFLAAILDGSPVLDLEGGPLPAVEPTAPGER